MDLASQFIISQLILLLSSCRTFASLLLILFFSQKTQEYSSSSSVYLYLRQKSGSRSCTNTIQRDTNNNIMCKQNVFGKVYYETESVSNIIIRSRQFSFPQGTKMRTGRKKIAKITDHHCVSSHTHLVFICSEQATQMLIKCNNNCLYQI